MATNRDLLREAIADAKAVKETAIANAKAALTESFTPFLKEKLSQKISEMEEGDMDEDMDEMMYNEADEGLDEISLDELLAELEESPEKEMEENLYEAKKDEEKDEKDEEMSLEDMSEDDLKSFIEDVIKDMVANKELEAGHEGMEDEEGDEEMDEPTDEEPTDETADETADEPADEEEVDLEELLAEMNDDPKEAIEEEASLIYATTTEAIAAISAILAGVSGIALATWKDELKNAAKDGVKAMKEKVKSLLSNDKNSSKEEDTKVEEELEEAYSTVKTLQSELNEINLLNAKLLYTNKIFRSKSLTESQKIKVLTAFDKAKTKKEAQLVYETLTEGLKVSITKTSIKESLGSASKSLGIAIKKPIIENDAFARMRELAGLKK
jgi:hypothetical protein